MRTTCTRVFGYATKTSNGDVHTWSHALEKEHSVYACSWNSMFFLDWNIRIKHLSIEVLFPGKSNLPVNPLAVRKENYWAVFLSSMVELGICLLMTPKAIFRTKHSREDEEKASISSRNFPLPKQLRGHFCAKRELRWRQCKHLNERYIPQLTACLG